VSGNSWSLLNLNYTTSGRLAYCHDRRGKTSSLSHPIEMDFSLSNSLTSSRKKERKKRKEKKEVRGRKWPKNEISTTKSIIKHFKRLLKKSKCDECKNCLFYRWMLLYITSFLFV